MELKLVYKGRLPDTNDMIGASNSNRHAWNKKKADSEKELRLVFLLQAGQRRMTGKSLATVHFFEKDRRRDEDNVIGGGCKLIFDALKDTGIIKNDGQKYIHLKPEVFVDKDDPRIEVTLTDMPQE